MKRVLKGTEPASFSDWKSSANDEWTPTYPTLQNPQKRDLHAALLQEQGYFCCYCGREIEAATSHIEHFRPQEHFEALALDYENLLASCLRETRPAIHCIVDTAKETGLKKRCTYLQWMSNANCASDTCKMARFSRRILRICQPLK